MEHPRPLAVLNHDPLVIHATIDSFLPLKHNLLDLLDAVAKRPYALIVQVGRPLEHLLAERPALVEGVALAVRRHDNAAPATRIWFACGTRADIPLAEERGLQARLLYPNVFVDDITLRLKPLLAKDYDALLIAPINEPRRNELAALVENLAVVPRAVPLKPGKQPADVKTLLPQARHTDPPTSLEGLSELICRSRAGLCLSDRDDFDPTPLGYWLSGVPVVCTALPGNRDPMFDASRTVFCTDSPIAVANAVSIAIARDFDPVTVRRGVLTRLWAYRNDWRQFMAQICTAMGNPGGNQFEPHFKALRDLDTGFNLTTVAALARVVAAGTGIAAADPAPSPRKPARKARQ